MACATVHAAIKSRCVFERVCEPFTPTNIGAHQGFIQFDVGEEEEAGLMGTVSKKQKAVREKERRQLTGEAGKLLYIEALQLLLRKQLLWLIKERGHREELETVVRDLWDLRIRGATALGQGTAAAVAASDDVLEVFSSQPTVVETTQAWTSRSKAQDWNPDRGLSWPVPRMTDTLALCYLGCYLLRIPTRLGELIKWANDLHFPYRHAVGRLAKHNKFPILITAQFHQLPFEMQERMPSHYIKLLKIPIRSALEGAQVYSAVMDLACSYYLNYNMIFPDLNYIPILVQYTKLMALPGLSTEATRPYTHAYASQWNASLLSGGSAVCSATSFIFQYRATAFIRSITQRSG